MEGTEGEEVSGTYLQPHLTSPHLMRLQLTGFYSPLCVFPPPPLPSPPLPPPLLSSSPLPYSPPYKSPKSSFNSFDMQARQFRQRFKKVL